MLVRNTLEYHLYRITYTNKQGNIISQYLFICINSHYFVVEHFAENRIQHFMIEYFIVMLPSDVLQLNILSDHSQNLSHISIYGSERVREALSN